jgi:hypothetical protein
MVSVGRLHLPHTVKRLDSQRTRSHHRHHEAAFASSIRIFSGVDATPESDEHQPSSHQAIKPIGQVG